MVLSVFRETARRKVRSDFVGNLDCAGEKTREREGPFGLEPLVGLIRLLRWTVLNIGLLQYTKPFNIAQNVVYRILLQHSVKI